MNSINPDATKYLVKAKINADGIVDKPDVVGAIFGQTEGLLGDDLDLRDLQKSGRIGRIEVEVVSKGGKSDGIIYMSSSLDQVETVILAASLETIDRVGPCKANIKVLGIEDVRITKREKIMERAKELLGGLVEQAKGTSANLTQTIRESVQVDEITTYGKERCPAGPNVKSSDAIIIVEGRSDVINLLKAGIKNAVAVEGTNIPRSVQELSREKITTAFVDGDRGGELILRELFQTSEIDFVARAPRAHEVEELSAKQLVKCLRNKVPGDQYMEMNGLSFEEKELPEEDREESVEEEEPVVEEPRRNRRDYDEPRYGKNERRSKRDRYNKDRHGRRTYDDEQYSPEKWKKKNQEEAMDEEEITDQVVDTIPIKRKLEEESESPVRERKTLRRKSRREPVMDEEPVSVEEEPVIEEKVEETPVVDEPQVEKVPAEETV
ncbi:MAG: DNA primase DnaG, partial [archaeon]|nr:DNA primase DnaG [archaeon]